MLSEIQNTYSCVHKSSDSFFSKILEKPSIVQKKNDTSYKRAGFFTEMKQKKKKKKNQNSRLKITSLSSSTNSQYLSWNFYGLVLGLIELIDAKGIEMSQTKNVF